MADEPQYKDAQLVMRHVPDVSLDKDDQGTVHQNKLPGHVEYGFMFGKRFQPVGGFKAGNVLNADGSHVEPAEEQPAQDNESQG